MHLRNLFFAWLLIAGVFLAVAGPSPAQVNTVNLSGIVLDPSGASVNGAKITLKSVATGAERTATSDSVGRYQIVGVPPGSYSITVEAAAFALLTNPSLTLTLGTSAEYNPQLTLKAATQTVNVVAGPEFIETTKTDVSQSITTTQITNLPINGRNYINFTLLDSQANRDSAPSIGAAPTSGLNFGGQRARSNEVSVDGADAVDNSVNGVRATVSQEAVQEFQLITNNYMPEYGRATGGVVNIVTKSGSNEVHGNIFGFLRHKSIQARNPFSVQVNPATGAVTAVKQPFTRVQAGVTIGGPIQKDKTFYFFSYEITRRQESGFSDIGSSLPGTGPFGLVPSTTPAVPIPGLALLLTPQQQAFVNNPAVLSAAGGPQFVGAYFGLAGSGSSVALAGIDPGLVAQGGGINPPFGPGPGARFPAPIDCSPSTPGNCKAANLVSLPASFVTMNSLIGNYPVKEGTSLYSLKLDHIWNSMNSSFVRASVTPSLVTGIQVNAQNQNFGENAGSRTSLQQSRDLAIVGQHTTSFRDNMFNEIRYQFARRGLHYGFSQLPGGSQVAVNMLGFAFFGREPFSTVDRIERRNQWMDNLTWVKGGHTFKFGGDANLIQIRSNNPTQIFQLDYGGRYDFSSLSPSDIGLCPNPPACTIGGVPIPSLSPVQAYGLGIPGDFLQGAGSSGRAFDNKTLGVFLQDTWKVNSRFTLNYGVRYDIEWTPIFKPETAINAAAEPAMNVLEGIPVDSNNAQPRIGFAWDPTGSGKTVIRGGYGLFYDHPLLAVAFDSTTADGALSSQLIFAPGAATATLLASNPGALNASSMFQGVLNTTGIPNVGYLPSQQRFNPLLPNSLFINQNFLTAGIPLGFLPFTFPVARNFVYAYSQQANLTVERELGRDFKIGLSYTYNRGLHLNRARNINAVSDSLLVSNDIHAINSGLVPPGTNPLLVAVPSTANTLCPGGIPAFNIPAGGSIAFATPAGPLAPSILGLGFTGQNCGGAPVGLIGSASVFNFFRPSGPNPSVAALVPGGYSTLVALAQVAGFPKGFSKGGVFIPVPWSDAVQQESSGNSIYHGFTVSVSKRLSHHFQLFSNWTWSHAIDDSTDLQSLLEPQDNRFANLERSNSTFDQRHRWVTSAVFESPYTNSDAGFWSKFLANFTLAPIFDVSTGRPYTVLTGRDINLDFSSTTDRPSVAPTGTAGSTTSPFVKNVAFIPPTFCPGVPASAVVPSPPFGCTGNLARNAFYRPGFFTIDLRVSRKFPIHERLNLEVIAEGFNMLNRFNIADVNLLCDPTSGSGACNAGQPSAALDPRQFQFALKVNW